MVNLIIKDRTLLALSLHLLMMTPIDASEFNNKSSWYKKYPQYHPYCSTPSQMEKRKIPPLKEDSRFGDTRLVHVTSIIRHGARTPFPSDTCWRGFWDNPETGIWDCELTTFMAPPTPKDVEREEGQPEDDTASNAMFFFEKKYDAFHNQKVDNLSNALNGTCQVGQLILHGYEQELANGRHLRAAYFYDGSDPYEQNPRMRLVDLNDNNELPFAEPQLHYRADDDQRTLMSGQVLLRGLFGQEFIQHLEEKGTQPVISLHTADRPLDIIAANAGVCPRINDLRAEAESSPEFQALNMSQEFHLLRTYMSKELDWNIEYGATDCMMTTMCTDRTLPDLINDYKGPNLDHITATTAGSNFFERLQNFNVRKGIFKYLYNNAAYSKLAITPLWKEIWENISPTIQSGKTTNNVSPRTKLAVFAGHDTTIIPLMASLGERLWNLTDWPPYASMMLIEIHEIIDFKTDRNIYISNFAFRLLYNGNVMTPLIDGCPPDADLCDTTILQGILEPIVDLPWDCHSAVSIEPKEAKALLSTNSWLLLIVILVGVSSVLSTFLTFMFLSGKLPRKKIRAGKSFDSYREGGLSLTDNYTDVPKDEKSNLYGSGD